MPPPPLLLLLMMMVVVEYKTYSYTFRHMAQKSKTRTLLHKLTVAQRVKKFPVLLKIQYHDH
jgi:hypothetical protein